MAIRECHDKTMEAYAWLDHVLRALEVQPSNRQAVLCGDTNWNLLCPIKAQVVLTESSQKRPIQLNICWHGDTNEG